jgi:succinoglycan biosynthesis protein ExoL
MNPAHGTNAAGFREIALFAHERGDARVRKRIAALSRSGWKLAGFTFHRVRDKADTPPDWDNIHLGTTYNRRYLQRLLAFAGAVLVLWRHRDRLADCGVVYAVNTDNALLSLLGMFLSGRRVPLVLELADIQPAMTGTGIRSRIFRWVERLVLDRTALLVTTSPGFVREYFHPVQQFRGEVFMLENKVYPSDGLGPVADAETVPAQGGRPWVIGCFGAFRCRRSLELMRELCDCLPGRVRFILRGYPAGTIAGEFHGLIENHPLIEFGGAYSYPDDLAAMYSGVDFNWAFDESDPGGNSAWLLPNRIYEGALFGVPAIAADATETGNWIRDRGLGWTFGEPLGGSLAAFFQSLETRDWTGLRRNCLAHPRRDFTGEDDYAALSRVLEALSNPDAGAPQCTGARPQSNPPRQ